MLNLSFASRTSAVDLLLRVLQIGELFEFSISAVTSSNFSTSRRKANFYALAAECVD